MVNREKVNEILFAGEKIACSKEEYHTEVRDSILDYQLRMVDLGKSKEARHCLLEVERLDKEHGIPPHHKDTGRGPQEVKEPAL